MSLVGGRGATRFSERTKMSFTPVKSFLIGAALVTPVLAMAQNATVNVIHGIRGQDLGLAADLPVDIFVNGNRALPGVTFGQQARVELPRGDYRIDIALAGTTTPVITANVRFGNRENATVIAHLTAAGAPTATKFRNHITNHFAGSFVPVTLHHTAAAPAVDVYARLGGFIFVPVVNNLRNGGRRELIVRSGGTTLAVTPRGQFTAVLGPATFNFAARKNHFVYVVGSVAGAAGNTLTVIADEQ